MYFVDTMKRQEAPRGDELEKQATTIAGILRKITSVLIYSFAAVMALRELGFDVAPLIAGAGVVGIAIGFGAQNLVRDVISGFFMLVENQIRVDDVVVINDIPGKVEEINLRTTVLRDMEGAVHIFPNGLITKLANRTQEYSYYVFTIHLNYQDDADAFLALLSDICGEVGREEPHQSNILAPLEILGIDALGESHVTVKARIKTMPGKQWDIGREVNRRLRPRALAAGIGLPVRGPRQVEIITTSITRDEIRQMVQKEMESRPMNNG
jgi:small conductance mechanosensitive channel